MKTTLLLMILTTIAVAQSTTTVHNQDGTVTKITASCDATGDCHVWDSTNDPSLMDIHKEVKAREAFCKAQHIPTSRMSAKKNQACVDAWEQHKLEGVK